MIRNDILFTFRRQNEPVQRNNSFRHPVHYSFESQILKYEKVINNSRIYITCNFPKQLSKNLTPHLYYKRYRV